MPSVAEELAALRARSITKSHASKLQDANGLSTPEQQAQALKTSTEKTRMSTYSKEAAAALKAGSKALDQDMDFKVQQIAQKKVDQQKQREAAKTNNAGTKAVDKTLDFEVQKIAQKRESLLRNKEAIETNNAGTKAVDKQLDFQVQKIAQKKEDKEKQREAEQNLQSFNEAKRVVGERKKSETQTSAAAQNGTQPKAAPSTQPSQANADPTPPPAAMGTKPAQPDAVETVPLVEDIPDVEDIPELEAAAPAPEPIAAPGPRQQNRAEKKARKFMQKLGLKPVPGISRVTLKMGGRQGFFTIQSPDVFQKGPSYIIFGEARQGAGPQQTQQQQAQAAQQLSAPTVSQPKVEPVVEEIPEVVDESGVESKDIELVISQAGCSRAQAVKALKENDGDLVNAIMAITS